MPRHATSCHVAATPPPRQRHVADPCPPPSPRAKIFDRLRGDVGEKERCFQLALFQDSSVQGGGGGGGGEDGGGSGSGSGSGGGAGSGAAQRAATSGGAEVRGDWGMLVEGVVQAVVDAFDLRRRRTEREVGLLLQRRSTVGWNYSTYFITQESVAIAWAQMGQHAPV